MSRKSEWPRSKTAIRLIRHGPTDDDGRCSFDLLWWNGSEHRAQSFFAKPRETMERLRRTLKERRRV